MSREALYYDLRNPYFTLDEKFEVECWYQAPGDLMVAAFTVLAVLHSLGRAPLSVVIALPLAINLVVAIPNWYFHFRRSLHVVFWLVGLPLVQTFVTVAAGLFIVFKGYWLLGLAVAACGFGASALFEPHIYLYTLLSRPHRMHPKYLFFRRFYGRRMPFESSG